MQLLLAIKITVTIEDDCREYHMMTKNIQAQPTKFIIKMVGLLSKTIHFIHHIMYENPTVTDIFTRYLYHIVTSHENVPFESLLKRRIK